VVYGDRVIVAREAGGGHLLTSSVFRCCCAGFVRFLGAHRSTSRLFSCWRISLSLHIAPLGWLRCSSARSRLRAAASILLHLASPRPSAPSHFFADFIAPAPTVTFRVYDVDNDGFISNADLYHVLKAMVGSNLNDVQLQQLVDRTIIQGDKDKDGKLNYEEFIDMIKDGELEQKLKIEF
jgi:hypothetical protein